MSITVTIYNDDEFGRDIQVVHLNPYGGSVKAITVQNADEKSDTKCEQYKLKNGELLIVSTAEQITKAEVSSDNVE